MTQGATVVQDRPRKLAELAEASRHVARPVATVFVDRGSLSCQCESRPCALRAQSGHTPRGEGARTTLVLSSGIWVKP